MKKQKVCLVTGAAGFIGSHLSRRLLEKGHRVYGVDCFTDYYDRQIKEENVADLVENENFTLQRRDIAEIDDSWFKDQVQWIFHQAAQAGVRSSWGKEFSHYSDHNVLATQRLLEWARRQPPERLVYASSSSVYGDVHKLPMMEGDLPRPLSPYGVTKLAAEHLVNLYGHNFALPVVSLRYFTVYGPRQRPDMAFHRFIHALLNDREQVIYGSGKQTRDFTFIDDIVSANLAAAAAEIDNSLIFNIGGGSRASVNQVINTLNRLAGKKLRVQYEPVQAGDPPHTYADTTRARTELGFKPCTTLEKGLAVMFDYYQSRFSSGG